MAFDIGYGYWIINHPCGGVYTRAQFTRNPTICLTQVCEVKSKWRSSLEDSSEGLFDTDGNTCTQLAVLVPTRYDHNCHDSDSMLCLAREREAKDKSWNSHHMDKDKGKLDRGYSNKIWQRRPSWHTWQWPRWP